MYKHIKLLSSGSIQQTKEFKETLILTQGSISYWLREREREAVFHWKIFENQTGLYFLLTVLPLLDMILNLSVLQFPHGKENKVSI